MGRESPRAVHERSGAVRERAATTGGYSESDRSHVVFGPSFLARPPQKGSEEAMSAGHAPRGSEVHASAVTRLEAACDDQQRLRDAAEAARGTAGEERADDELRRARQTLATREAWLVWLERGF